MLSRLAFLRITALIVLAVGTACSKPNADEHFRKASAYLDQSRLPEAIFEYRLALQAGPTRGDIRLKLADA